MSDPIYLIIVLAVVGIAPFFAVMITSYTKLAIVFSLVRNALGTQQIPPNMVVNSMAIVLSLYVMSPIGSEVFDLVKDEQFNNMNIKSIGAKLGKAKEPIRSFLMKHTNAEERMFFAKSIKNLDPKKTEEYQQSDIIVLVPAFTVAELTEAFKIGFLLYLPFIAIDIIISNILMAMGMIMVSPMIISLPFKLLLFVLLNGWTRIIHGLILTYS